MNRIVLTIAFVLASGISGLALAQQTPPGTQPPPSAPPSDTTSSSAEQRAQMKECVAQQEQQQSTTGMSKKDIEKYCINQVKSAPASQPH